MPNIAVVLKQEISRLARKEAKAATDPLKSDIAKLKTSNADLKRRVALLERANKVLMKAEMSRANEVASVGPQTSKVRLTAKGIRALRRKTGLTQADFARLVGVTNQAVSYWEKQEGSLRLKEKTKAKLLSLKGVGAKEARQRLSHVN